MKQQDHLPYNPYIRKYKFTFHNLMTHPYNQPITLKFISRSCNYSPKRVSIICWTRMLRPNMEQMCGGKAQQVFLRQTSQNLGYLSGRSTLIVSGPHSNDFSLASRRQNKILDRRNSLWSSATENEKLYSKGKHIEKAGMERFILP